MEKYSLFQIEKPFNNSNNLVEESPLFLLETFDDLETAKKEQKEYDFKTIILKSYE